MSKYKVWNIFIVLNKCHLLEGCSLVHWFISSLVQCVTLFARSGDRVDQRSVVGVSWRSAKRLCIIFSGNCLNRNFMNFSNKQNSINSLNSGSDNLGVTCGPRYPFIRLQALGARPVPTAIANAELQRAPCRLTGHRCAGRPSLLHQWTDEPVN